MIKCYFGVPGCGKSTNLTKVAIKELRRLRKIYDHIYTINFQCDGCIHIEYDDLKKYKFYNSLILIDEITLNADSRSFKTFTKEELEFFVLHRHFGVDIIYSTQNFENVDKKIRDLTSELWYMSKSVVPFFKEFTISKRIYRKININEHTSELVLGYRFCNLLESFFTSNFEICFRRLFYKYFDSFDELTLKNRPVYTNNIIYHVPKKKRFSKIFKIFKGVKK
uniref:ZOT protein n=1 Tax=Dulem virus 71 TaxID=3145782 RepID=A0AAU8AZ43_9VIRU